MKPSMQPYKGARDFYPEDKAVQKWIFNKWRRVVERYGYVEYDAPILEPTDLYLIKGSEEIIQEQTYTFLDRGERSVTIRTEMTPSVSRMIAGRRQELAYPVRWYSIPNLWRYERMQRGRLREFWQLNVDMFGVENGQAELEMIQIVDDLFQAFKAKRTSYVIKVNSRVLVTEVLTSLGILAERTVAAIRLIDKIQKMPPKDFALALDHITGSSATSRTLISFLAVKEIDELPEQLRSSKSAQEIAVLLSSARALGIRNVEFDMTLMRGFDYYTDIVFEAFATDTENNRSVLGGGRYDGLVGQFGVEPVPTVGFAVGDVVFSDFLMTNKLIPVMKQTIDVVVLVRDEQAMAGAVLSARELREIGVNTAVDTTGRKLDKQLKSAIKSGVRYIVFIGVEELETEQFTLKDVKTGKEEKHSLARIVSIVKDARK
ncbi:MAG TPA: histidine--tRNA ligase [Candidatus Saccharibacteria bacterium]|jgi:histidyl-tRNA synthetase|nr:histidine--tRNA ligase [Candidatus Saccharibacteria bacterium]HMT55541.1 histidine--tRNA ligase [Candidatus Saccharibacteria bacterium]